MMDECEWFAPDQPALYAQGTLDGVPSTLLLDKKGLLFSVDERDDVQNYWLPAGPALTRAVALLGKDSTRAELKALGFTED